MKDPKAITQSILVQSLQIADSSKAQAILVYADVFQDHAALHDFIDAASELPVVFATRKTDKVLEDDRGRWSVIQVPDVQLTRLGQLKIALLLGVSSNVFSKGEVVVCLSGMADSGLLDTIVVMAIDDEFEMLGFDETETMDRVALPEVFARVLDLAVELGVEGREGKPVGTTFILGDGKDIEPYLKQMVLNPFKGYPASERNILDPALKETIREFAAIDGAFFIDKKGLVQRAGAFVACDIQSGSLPPGLGARHNSAAGLTAATQSLAITVSESSGNVTIFRDGKIVMEIERPRPVGSKHLQKLDRDTSSPYSTHETPAGLGAGVM